jgi:hypothetical protein
VLVVIAVIINEGLMVVIAGYRIGAIGVLGVIAIVGVVGVQVDGIIRVVWASGCYWGYEHLPPTITITTTPANIIIPIMSTIFHYSQSHPKHQADHTRGSTHSDRTTPFTWQVTAWLNQLARCHVCQC